ncbi:MAG: 3-phosphoserine/phosphohydroxythreonine transaminase [Planctomycetales bacterium]|nr:3-phosphoserine/phosphohydroxythreonine transaminase [Planctomycetales bacterium]
MATQSNTQRVFNFSAGPAVLPMSVLEQAQAELICLPGAGASVLEISHRGAAFIEIMNSAVARLRDLLGISDEFEVLLLQGGSRLQFSMTAINLAPGAAAPPDYVITGTWGKKALEEAQKVCAPRVVWDGKPHNYSEAPDWSSLELNPQAAYAYITSNETIQGVQLPTDLDSPAPLVCDSSSDFLSRPVPMDKYGLLYACAQKNAGPAGVTVVIIRKDLMGRAPSDTPGYLDYRNHAEAESMYNTPPTFAIYLLDLVCKWLQQDVGGLANIERQNIDKANQVYTVIDESDGFYQGHAEKSCRSMMNATFRMANEQLDKQFIAEAREQGLDGLKGHRSVGGVRVSMYNAMPLEGISTLCQFMRDFMNRNG